VPWLSINNGQGQTLAKRGLVLRKTVSSKGQFYVAMSRVGSYADVKVLVATTESQRLFRADDRVEDGAYTAVVWKEALGQSRQFLW
jgi:hypothetical protein